MQDYHYKPEATLNLLGTDRVTNQTREVLQQRLDEPAVTNPQFFTMPELDILKAICACLVPQQPDQPQVDLAGILDKQLASGEGDGWRYDALPDDETAHKQGLAGINETAQALHQQAFTTLSTEAREEVLTVVQQGNPPGEIWKTVPAKLFFEELLAEVVSAYYSHPLAKDEIGDASWADQGGWHHFGLNVTESFEPPVI